MGTNKSKPKKLAPSPTVYNIASGANVTILHAEKDPQVNCPDVPPPYERTVRNNNMPGDDSTASWHKPCVPEKVERNTIYPQLDVQYMFRRHEVLRGHEAGLLDYAASAPPYPEESEKSQIYPRLDVHNKTMNGTDLFAPSSPPPPYPKPFESSMIYPKQDAMFRYEAFSGHVADLRDPSDTNNICHIKPQTTHMGIASSKSYEHNPNFRDHIGYMFLKSLASKDTVDIIATFSIKKGQFIKLIKGDLNHDWLVILIKLLGKLCSSDLHNNKKEILAFMCCDEFLRKLIFFVQNLPTRQFEFKYEESPAVIADLITFYEAVFKELPSTACEKLSYVVIVTYYVVQDIEGFSNIKSNTDIELRFQVLVKEMAICKENHGNRILQALNCVQPPNNFRSLNLIPKPDDILSKGMGFIRPNVVRGAYRSAEHYLDVQFRLLREDFFISLRECISDYLNQMKSGVKSNNLLVYNNVTFVGSKVCDDSIAEMVNFDPKGKQKKTKWDQSKQFRYGSLVCFTRSNFTDIFFGKIADRNVDDLNKGQMLVKLQDIQDTDLYNGTFTMVESGVYFEPYFHVMQALQSITADNFPMPQYIIRVQSTCEPPKYMRNCTLYQVNGNAVKPLHYFTWPNAKDLNLSESQYKAFYSALTKEFAVIQGPPGTGKTHLGLRIVEVLLQNIPLWNSSPRPILVVCYTNHALDQFLEGILYFTDKIIRVGGQSKCSTLDKYNIREKRREKQSGPVYSALRMLRSEMVDLKHEIQTNENAVHVIVNNRGIIAFSSLIQSGIPDYQKACFRENLSDNMETKFIEWLDHGIETNLRNPLRLSSPPHDEESDMHDNGDPLLDDFHLTINEETIDCNIDLAVDFELLKKISKPGDNKLEYYMKNVEKLKAKPGVASKDSMRTTLDLWLLSPSERWSLYGMWVQDLRDYLLNELQGLRMKYRDVLNQYNEFRDLVDLKLLRNSLIVGMTTTCAASFRELLCNLKPRIVIVEEAAEVLEAHIITSLTGDIEHLILIGDHQQLRPSPAAYELANEYDLDISLFERMVKNGISCHKLLEQHRMRPEIAELLTPAIYDVLHNHSSVENYPDIRGVTKNVFFVMHQELETKVDETTTRMNDHEGKFVIALAKYLVQQGYSIDDITILAAYTGQMNYILSEKDKNPLVKDVNVCVIDNFQGQESKIIILSLVRSNMEASIGFLTTENRVCVALSRAREGLYIIGNMMNLVAKSRLWKKMKNVLVNRNNIGSHLTLVCERHTNQFTNVACAEDFKRVPEGGCMLICNSELKCGHRCKHPCHDIEGHGKKILCLQPCRRIMDSCRKHTCQKLCHQECGQCTVRIKLKQMCGHTLIIQCHELNGMNTACVDTCNHLLKCGHKCGLPCHAQQGPEEHQVQCQLCPCENFLACGHPCKEPKVCPCTIKCLQNVNLKLPCGHTTDVLCSTLNSFMSELERSEELMTLCQRQCDAVLDCGHRCYGTCGGCHQGRVHMPCKGHTKRTLICGHKYNEVSCQLPNIRCVKKCLFKCKHSSCEMMCGQSCSLCKFPCDYQCEHMKCSKLCCEMCDRKPCYEACKKILPCGHACLGFCGEPCPEVCKTCKPPKVKHRKSLRYVVLADCKHYVIANRLDQRQAKKGGKVEFLKCPICGALILSTQRYSNYVKELFKDLADIKTLETMDVQKITSFTEKIENLHMPKGRSSILHRKYCAFKANMKKQLHGILITDVFQIPIQYLMFANVILPLGGSWPRELKSHVEWLLLVIMERGGNDMSIQTMYELHHEIISFTSKLGSAMVPLERKRLDLEIKRIVYRSNSMWFKCEQKHLCPAESLEANSGCFICLISKPT